MDMFSECAEINTLLEQGEKASARDLLIRLLDKLGKDQQGYNHLLNHLIRETGLFPYMDPDSASWRDRFVFESFKVDIGERTPITLHSEQSLVLKYLVEGKSLAVSAPTSFGKSLIIDAYIAICKPRNVVILVPTIALTDETRRRLSRKFSTNYRVITTTDVQPAERNIFFFPQERALSYCGLIEEIDLFVVDEFYKASRAFDRERSPALLKAMIKLGEKASQRYYLAPNVTGLVENTFTREMLFLRLDFNTVFLEKHELYKNIKRDPVRKNLALINVLGAHSEKTLIYAGTHANVGAVASLLTENLENCNSELLFDFSEWLATHYHPNWQLTTLVRRGVGFHTGRLHRSLSQIQIRLFEMPSAGIQTLISTSSIIEGVNTSAENVVVWSNRKGQLKLDDFSYRNIIGRSGRMFRHFIGKVFLLEEPPDPEDNRLDLTFPDELLADVDEEKFREELSNDQLAKIIHYREEMNRILGQESFARLQDSGLLLSSDTKMIAEIVTSIIENKRVWRGLANLNAAASANWTWILMRVLRLVPSGWDATYTKFSEFVRVLSNNWTCSIPELLDQLSEHDLTIDDFFKLEKNATFKLSALLSDINVIQREVVPEHGIDISSFVGRLAKGFLPSCVMELEEYGLPRMISRKLHGAGVINLEGELDIHSAVEQLRARKTDIFQRSDLWDKFDLFVLQYFYEGVAES